MEVYKIRKIYTGPDLVAMTEFPNGTTTATTTCNETDGAVDEKGEIRRGGGSVDSDMCVCASFKLDRNHLNNFKSHFPARLASLPSRPIDSADTSDSATDVRRLVETSRYRIDEADYVDFSIPPSTLLRKLIHPHLESQERQRVETYLRYKAYLAGGTSGSGQLREGMEYRFRMQVPVLEMRRFYWPFYVFEREMGPSNPHPSLNSPTTGTETSLPMVHDGDVKSTSPVFREEVVRDYMCGVTGRLSSTPTYDPRCVGILSASITSLFSSLPTLPSWIGSMASMSGSSALMEGLTVKVMAWWMMENVVGPYFVGSTLTRLVPMLMNVFRRTRTELEEGIDCTALQHHYSSTGTGQEGAGENGSVMRNVWWEVMVNKSVKGYDEWVREQTMQCQMQDWKAYTDHRGSAEDTATASPSGDAWIPIQHADPMGLYKVLGLEGRERTVSDVDIGRAFKRQALKMHPDASTGVGGVGGVGSDASQQRKSEFQQLSLAYSVLKSKEGRAYYDEFGKLPLLIGAKTGENR